MQEFEDDARVEVQLQVSRVQNKMSHAKWHTLEFILEAKQVINFKKKFLAREVAKLVVVLYLQEFEDAARVVVQLQVSGAPL